MSDPISAVAWLDRPAPTPTAEVTASIPDLFVRQLNDRLLHSSELLQQSAAGQAVPTHELMLSLELAKQQLQLAVEVRNKVTEAYQELMRMQL